ncbi:MAG: hypothetical protein UW79_C0036G0007 [Candidatus Yanofskybacteria bacterium GW2011_GWA2_44_9]|uniref:Nudix hydrolase domain-containing protein n=1 Tax=Candidatus Yanofskybacteria bacterium GW2011_GWA2_44_9 TaxID=1619025 RepID=A0A0G1N954_9BACT|nr:MAG: hypothetical protein UW79_C0036G0007 [Candidatus Yanofskybacteria bacterium GW2011_GWA2_44_9]
MDTESIWTQRDPEPFLDENGELIPPSETVSVLSINFDSVTSNPDKSRADEIMLLTVKNKKQPPKSREKKPPGIGLPGGGVESKESLKHAADRESDGEAGYKLLKIYGEVFTDHRTHINNVVRIFLAEPSDLQTSIRESDEVDPNWKNWVSLRSGNTAQKSC